MLMDELDLLLFEELKADVRQPVRAIARKLDVKRSTIRYRLERLLSEGFLRILCKSDTKRLGYNVLIVFGLRTPPDRIMEVADHLASLQAVKHICLTNGRFNIMAWGVYRDESEVAHFVSNDLAVVSNISSIEIMHIIQRLKELVQTRSEISAGEGSVQLNDLDLSLIDAMQQDPRQTITNIAQNIGCSQSVAKKRLNALINEGIIRMFPILDPTVFGATDWVLILIKLELDKISATIEMLSSLQTIVDISLVSGQWQLVVVGGLQEGKHMYDSISDAISLVHGIKEFEVLPLVKVVKFSPSFL